MYKSARVVRQKFTTICEEFDIAAKYIHIPTEYRFKPECEKKKKKWLSVTWRVDRLRKRELCNLCYRR